jgi:hypothetical protein
MIKRLIFSIYLITFPTKIITIKNVWCKYINVYIQKHTHIRAPRLDISERCQHFASVLNGSRRPI